jgi:hypothetical protein
MQFCLGSVMLALAMGLLAGSLIFPRATHSQEAQGEGRAGRYAVVTGIRGSAPSTQSLYLIDDATEILFAFEYNSRSNKLEYQTASDVQRYASKLVEERARRERGRRPGR